MTAALILAMAPGPALAQRQVTADEALANYRKMFKSTGEIDCPREEGEIVVCGRRSAGPDPYRLPLPVEREPGERVRGEATADAGGCISRCHQPVAINILGIPSFLGKVIERLKDD